MYMFLFYFTPFKYIFDFDFLVGTKYTHFAKLKNMHDSRNLSYRKKKKRKDRRILRGVRASFLKKKNWKKKTD